MGVAGEVSQLEHYDAIVLGAGVSGLVSTAILLDAGAPAVAVIDEYPTVGGNHLDVAIGPFTFDVGSFIFQNDSPLLRWFPELMQSYVPIEPSWSRLNPQGIVTDYPFSVRDDLLRAGPVEMLRILGSLVAARVRHGELANARDFAEHWLGRRLVARSGLLHYMERFCGMPAERIDLRFARSRMGWIAEYAQVRTHVKRFLIRLRSRTLGSRDATVSRNTQLARPRSGFAELYAPIVDRLAAQGAIFHLGQRPRRVARDGERFVLTIGERTISADRVISTVPIDIALKMVGADVDPLPTVTLVSLFYSFAGERGFRTSILYNFASSAAWKRLTTYSDFYGPAQGREYFAVEVIAKTAVSTVDAADEEFRSHVADAGLFIGDLRLEGGRLLKHAYPVYTEGSGDRAEALVAVLRNEGIESFGRQGGFQYQPTSRVSTRTVEDALDVTHVDVPPLPVGRPAHQISPDGPDLAEG